MMSYLRSAIRHFCRVLLVCVQSFIISALTAQTIMAQAPHLLDPLTTEEIKTAARVLTTSAQFPQGALFSTIVLKEPSKKEVLSYTPGAPFSRQAFSVILDRKRNRTVEAVVDLKTERVLSWLSRGQ